MKHLLIVFLLCGLGVAQDTKPAEPKSETKTESKPSQCVIVKHKGTIGRRLLFTALIGVPIAPGAKYDLVDSLNYPAKLTYKGGDLEKIQKQGVHVVVLDNKYSVEQLNAAHESCKASRETK